MLPCILIFAEYAEICAMHVAYVYIILMSFISAYPVCSWLDIKQEPCYCNYTLKKAGVIMAELTIRDIAKQAGVSVATVSRVINGNGNVKPELKNVFLT